ncbi:hypothetical protein [Glutamicibacter arilaitensis]|uniref:hypothetical protein n=1 Tax=Glutamicibacter arilaitensis TaxID=256701 RepID=UPI003FD5A916
MNITDTLTGSIFTDTISNSLVIGANATNLKGGWDKVWGAFTSGWGGFSLFLTMVGVLLAVIGIVTAIIKARRNDGHGAGKAFKGQWIIFLLAGVMAGPQLILPVLLGTIDILINVGFSLWQTFFGVKK